MQQPQIKTLTNPMLQFQTRVELLDGREGHIGCKAEGRHERLMSIHGQDGLQMMPVNRIARAWPRGVEHLCSWDGLSLKPIG